MRREEAKHVDPETAETNWWYGQTLDPYGVISAMPEHLSQVGRECFARRPCSDIWVHFGDLTPTCATSFGRSTAASWRPPLDCSTSRRRLTMSDTGNWIVVNIETAPGGERTERYVGPFPTSGSSGVQGRAAAVHPVSHHQADVAAD